jgi:hypothetical protein
MARSVPINVSGGTDRNPVRLGEHGYRIAIGGIGMDELRNAQERSEMGWDREDAIDAIGSSIRVLKLTTRATEDHLTNWLTSKEDDWEHLHADLAECAAEWKIYVRGVRREVGDYTAVVRDYYSQLNRITSILESIGKIIGIGPVNLVKMAKDLAVVTEKLMNLSMKVNQVFDQLDAKSTARTEALEDKLAPEQLRQVLEWIEEAK